MDMHDAIEEYNNYITNILNNIMDFNLWYENTTGTPVPAEWCKYVVCKRENPSTG